MPSSRVLPAQHRSWCCDLCSELSSALQSLSLLVVATRQRVSVLHLLIAVDCAAALTSTCLVSWDIPAASGRYANQHIIRSTSMASKAEQLADAKKRVREAFIVFETKEGSRLANTKDIPTIVRSLGVNPTTAQVQVLLDQIAAAVPPEQSSTVTLEHCEGTIASWLLDTKDTLIRDDYHVLMRAFRALDPDNRGYINAEQLKAVLTTCDDALSTEEMNSMISTAADDQGRVLYQEYALKLAVDGKAI